DDAAGLGVGGELDVAAAGVDADLADDRDAEVAQLLHLDVGEGQRGGDGDRVAGVHADRVHVLDRADDHAVVGAVAHELELELLPAQDRLLEQDLRGGRVVQAVAADAAQVRLVVGHAGAEPAHGEAGAHDHRVAELVGRLEQLVHGVADAGERGVTADAVHDLLGQLAVLGPVDRLEVRAVHLDAERREGAVLGQGDRGVQRGLAAEGGQERVGALLGDDRADDVRVDRLDVGRVRDVRVGHDRGRVGVDEDDAQALLAQHAAGLGAGVVELRGLADDDRAGADDEDGGDIGTAGHQDSLEAVAARWAIASSARRSKRGEASWGPPAASGWYWTE